MRKLTVTATAIILALALVQFWSVRMSRAEGVPRISQDDLKNHLGSADWVIIDVRTDRDWASSNQKIRGAIRENPGIVEFWASKYPKDKNIVLYCA